MNREPELSETDRRRRFASLGLTRNAVVRGVRADWNRFVGAGLFITGATLYLTTILVTVAQVLLLAGAGWIARDTSASLLTRLSSDELPWSSGQEREQPARAGTPATESSDETDGPGSRPSAADGEERVLALLDATNGRIHQKEIVERIDRSKSTVSKYLSRLEERGELVKVTRGRENIIYRPGEVPDAVPQSVQASGTGTVASGEVTS